MRVLFVIAAMTAAMFFDPGVGHAYQGPWCAVQSVGSGSVVENCRMLSFEQCRMEVIAGNRGFCKPNAYWRGPVVVEHPRRSRKHRARHH